MKRIIWSLSGVMLVFALALVISVLRQPPQMVQGSAITGQEYMSTTTQGSNVAYAVLKSSSGSLGSVITTITGTGPMTFYDATTSDATKRVGSMATSSLKVLAYFGASPTVGNYIFDSVFNDGLLVVWGTGTVSSSTITWR
jgi:hypothetical protein